MLHTYEPKTVCICCYISKKEMRRAPVKCYEERRHIWNTAKLTKNVQLIHMPAIRKDGA